MANRYKINLSNGYIGLDIVKNYVEIELGLKGKAVDVEVDRTGEVTVGEYPENPHIFHRLLREDVEVLVQLLADLRNRLLQQEADDAAQVQAVPVPSFGDN